MKYPIRSLWRRALRAALMGLPLLAQPAAHAQTWQVYEQQGGKSWEINADSLRSEGELSFFEYRERFGAADSKVLSPTIKAVVNCGAQSRADIDRQGAYSLKFPYAGTAQEKQIQFVCKRVAAAAAAPGTGGAAAPAKAALGVAFLYVGPVGDGGWTYSHEQGRRALEAALGDRIRTTHVENVPESDAAEGVLREVIARDNRLVFATTFGHMTPLLRVAAGNEAVRFEHATGYKTAANVRTYDARTCEAAYLAGLVAGKMTKTGTLGFVAAIPIPETVRAINAFTLGAQQTNPRIKTRVAWVGSWFHPPKEGEAAQQLIQAGADVLIQNTDSPAVLQTAQRLGKRAFGWDSDMALYGRQAHLGSAVIQWGPYYIQATRDMLDGNWVSGRAWWGVKEGAVDLVNLAADVPAEVQQQVQAARQGLANDTLKIWPRPLLDNQGRTVLGAQQTVDDRFLGGMNFLVRGVEGSLPSGK